MKNRNKTIRNTLQCMAMLIIMAWLAGFFMGYSTIETESVFRVSLITIVFLTFVTIFASDKWWQRVAWSITFLVFLAILILWTGWDQAQFQF